VFHLIDYGKKGLEVQSLRKCLQVIIGDAEVMIGIGIAFVIELVSDECQVRLHLDNRTRQGFFAASPDSFSE
jgi:hypothetical protein